MILELCLVGLAALLGLLVYSLAGWRKSDVRELKGIPLLGMGPKLAFMPYAELVPWVGEMVAEYGGAIQANISGLRNVILTDPKEVEILLSSVNYIEKGYEYFILKPWLREGLLLSGGRKWHERRKLLTPTFHFKILDDSMHILSQNAVRFVDRILKTNGKPYRLELAVRSSTLDVICEAALGLNMSVMDEHKAKYVSSIKRITDLATRWYFKFWLHIDFLFRLSDLGKSYYEANNIIHSFSEKVIIDRKQEYLKNRTYKVENENGEKRKFAFLDRLLELDAENPGLLSHTDIQEEVDTFTFEGHDTVAAALVFSMFLLANHPEIQERAAEEQVDIFLDSDRQPIKEDLASMPYLEMVIKESLRLYPSVPFFSRWLTQDLVLSNGNVVPSGYNVLVLAYYVHRNPEHWEDPETFNPERFLPGQERHPFSYIPFSAGPRNCIGQKFAMMEMKITLSSVLRRCRLEPVTKTVTPTPNIIMSSVEPIFVKIFPRN